MAQGRQQLLQTQLCFKLWSAQPLCNGRLAVFDGLKPGNRCPVAGKQPTARLVRNPNFEMAAALFNLLENKDTAADSLRRWAAGRPFH